MKLQNNLKSFINSKNYSQPYYLNQGIFQQNNLFIYQDWEKKNQNFKSDNKNNNISIIKNTINNILVKANESPPKIFKILKINFYQILLLLILIMKILLMNLKLIHQMEKLIRIQIWLEIQIKKMIKKKMMLLIN